MSSFSQMSPVEGPREPQSALVLGGGFAGVETAIRLRKSGLKVTVVSDRPQLFVYPTSIWVVTGEHRVEQDLMDLTELASQHGFEFVVGKVDFVDAERRVVSVGEHIPV